MALDYTIYTIGNFEFMHEVLHGVAKFFSDTGGMWAFATVASALSLFAGFLFNLANPKPTDPIKQFIVGLVLFYILMGPDTRVEVEVQDTHTGNFLIVDDVPFLVGFGGYLTTGAMRDFVDELTWTFSTPNGYDVSGGTLDPLRAMSALRQLRPTDETCTGKRSHGKFDICSTIRSYWTYCVSRDKVTNSTNREFWEGTLSTASPGKVLDAIRVDYNGWEVPVLLDTAGSTSGVQWMGCGDAWQEINDTLTVDTITTDGETFQTLLETSAELMGVDHDALTEGLNKQLFTPVALANASQTASNIMLDRFMNYQIKEAAAFDPNGTSVELARFQAIEQRHMNQAADRSLWLEMSLTLATFFEAFAIFLAPIMGILLVIGGKTVIAAITYFGMLMWVNTWPVVIVLINLYTDYAVSGRFTDGSTITGNPLSFAGMETTLTTAESFLATSSTLVGMVPALTLYILHRGVHTMLQTANAAAPNTNIDSKLTAPDLGAAANVFKMASGDTSYARHAGSGAWTANQGEATVGGQSQMDVKGSFDGASGQVYSNALSEQRTSSDQYTQASNQLWESGKQATAQTGASTGSTAERVNAYQAIDQAAAQMNEGTTNSISNTRSALIGGTLAGKISADSLPGGLGAAIDALPADIKAQFQAQYEQKLAAGDADTLAATEGIRGALTSQSTDMAALKENVSFQDNQQLVASNASRESWQELAQKAEQYQTSSQEVKAADANRRQAASIAASTKVDEGYYAGEISKMSEGQRDKLAEQAFSNPQDLARFNESYAKNLQAFDERGVKNAEGLAFMNAMIETSSAINMDRPDATAAFTTAWNTLEQATGNKGFGAGALARGFEAATDLSDNRELRPAGEQGRLPTNDVPKLPGSGVKDKVEASTTNTPDIDPSKVKDDTSTAFEKHKAGAQGTHEGVMEKPENSNFAAMYASNGRETGKDGQPSFEQFQDKLRGIDTSNNTPENYSGLKDGLATFNSAANWANEIFQTEQSDLISEYGQKHGLSDAQTAGLIAMANQSEDQYRMSLSTALDPANSTASGDMFARGAMAANSVSPEHIGAIQGLLEKNDYDGSAFSTNTETSQSVVATADAARSTDSRLNFNQTMAELSNMGVEGSRSASTLNAVLNGDAESLNSLSTEQRSALPALEAQYQRAHEAANPSIPYENTDAAAKFQSAYDHLGDAAPSKANPADMAASERSLFNMLAQDSVGASSEGGWAANTYGDTAGHMSGSTNEKPETLTAVQMLSGLDTSSSNAEQQEFLNGFGSDVVNANNVNDPSADGRVATVAANLNAIEHMGNVASKLGYDDIGTKLDSYADDKREELGINRDGDVSYSDAQAHAAVQPLTPDVNGVYQPADSGFFSSTAESVTFDSNSVQQMMSMNTGSTIQMGKPDHDGTTFTVSGQSYDDSNAPSGVYLTDGAGNNFHLSNNGESQTLYGGFPMEGSGQFVPASQDDNNLVLSRESVATIASADQGTQFNIGGQSYELLGSVEADTPHGINQATLRNETTGRIETLFHTDQMGYIGPNQGTLPLNHLDAPGDISTSVNMQASNGNKTTSGA
ncbi:conjugal transfer protein TraG N-terminal domain-containing protein [Neiella marina]|uniref:Conjugal transfer protein TraG N-terminal domain-containing protein n=1 Tax=Neiella holothuriorum TaxID=2870530 RepID=A0ABS7EGE3_9GAMM|nr:conjugal transfer protein TraG N-terminal domain-containing protein [Neiella holothuriorum]MBW8191395.1 conjugal transfer protein TraG N-terminal domain-containing protein [Neiella holothuriorum]